MNRACVVLGVCGLAIVTAGGPAWAQRARTASDAQIVAQADLVVAGDRVEIHQHGVNVNPAFLKVAEDAYGRLEGLTGRRLDTATLGPRIRIYVSDAVTISHVWKGYAHPTDPKAIVFLNPRVYAGALRGINATYAHEMTHLFTWRYHSHTLREGLADYLALTIHPGAGVGPNPHGYDRSMTISPEIVECLGTTKPAPAWLATDAGSRQAYYFASYRFVKHLVDKAGMELFMKLYDSERPEADIVTLYGVTRETLIRSAGL